jgi:uncharacterized protein with PQ loop repeat
MNSIELLYISMTSLSVFASLPQIRQLIVLKRSDEFSLTTWIIWTLAQISALFYSIHINSIPYLAVNIIWIIFYVVMLFLILKYRTVAKNVKQELATVKE